MKLRGINRIVIAVKDIQKGIDLYSKMLGATFHDASGTGEPMGINVAISWDAGIELCAPIPGKDVFLAQHIEQNGEGIMAVVFGVSDADEARDIAEKAGIKVLVPINYSQDEIDKYLEGMFQKYKEYVIDSTDKCGFSVMLGQIEPKQEEP